MKTVLKNWLIDFTLILSFYFLLWVRNKNNSRQVINYKEGCLNEFIEHSFKDLDVKTLILKSLHSIILSELKLIEVNFKYFLHFSVQNIEFDNSSIIDHLLLKIRPMAFSN